MKIKTEKEFRAYQADMESIIAKGTSLGDMELLSEESRKKQPNDLEYQNPELVIF